MAKKVPEAELNEVWEVVADHPDGIAVSKIAENLFDGVSRRTLQHRLKLLVDGGRLQRVGRGAGVKYCIPASGFPSDGSSGQQEEYSRLINLSSGGKAVRDYVRQPPGAREAMGYNRNFLDQYEPNSTFHLDERERERLKKIGETPAAGEMPAGSYAKMILNYLLIDLSWNSSRLECNTYSLLDAKRLIEFDEKAKGKDIADAQMILNHKRAIEFLVNSSEDTNFNKHTILNLHGILSNNLMSSPMASGRLRRISIGIGKSVYHPLDNPHVIEECFEEVLRKAAVIEDPFEQSFFAMVHLPYLQPFEDVNKRVSRLSANIPLIRDNYAPLSFTELPRRAYIEAVLGVYELNDVALLKDIFFWSYRKSAKKHMVVRETLGDPDPFRMKYHVELQELIRMLIHGKIERNRVLAEIARWTQSKIRADDRDKFAETVEDLLLGLHEGNFAVYRITQPEFKAWHDVWGRN